MKLDVTVLAIPAFIGAMGAEYAWQRAHPVAAGTRAGDYQLADTLASLSMGAGSLAAPYVAKRLLDPVTPGVGRYGRLLLGLGAATAVLTTVGDVVVRRLRDGRLPDSHTVPAEIRATQEELAQARQAPATPRADRPDRNARARRIRGGLAVSAVFSTVLTVSTVWAAQTSGEKLFRRTPLDLGEGRLAWAAAILGWDFLYYWNHRLQHESRWLWAMHEYLDRNHGGILIVWDRIFGTFEPEDEQVVYGLTRNIDSYNPVVIATHEWHDIAVDVAGSDTWRDRWNYLLRRPGWAYRRRDERLVGAGRA